MKALIICLIAVSGAFAQNTKAILWSPDPACGEKVGLPEKDTLKCDMLIVDGKTVVFLTHNGMGLAGSYSEQGDYLVFDSYITNKTGNRILVDPAFWSVVHYKSEADANAQKALKVEGPVSAQTIADKLTNRIRWANALAGLGAAFQTQTATVNATSSTGQTAQATVTAPDYGAQARAASQNAARTSNAAVEGQNIANGGLYANTVLDQQTVFGLVYFKKNKKAKYSILRAQIEGVFYVFEIRK